MSDATPATPPSDPLAGLVEISLPSPPSLWPQTPAALALAAILILGVAVALWWLIRRRVANRYRRAALAELARIEVTLASWDRRGRAVAAIAELVRRTALVAFPRDVVVPLSGAAWLAFLDRSYDGKGFSAGPGRVLVEAPYESPDHTALGDPAPLLALVRRWIWVHHV